MKKNLSKTAFSLIELIVTSLLVIIVMLGAFSINSVLTNNNQDYGQRYSVKSVTQITLNHILNNASLAVGSGTADNYGNIDQGILWGAGNPPEITNGVYNNFNGVGDPNSFCIHQAANNNIVNAANDIWLCYTWYPSSDPTNPYQIFWCTSNFTTAGALNSNRGAAVPCAENTNFLGTAFINPVSSITFNSTSGFSITLLNCLNNAALAPAACSVSGPPSGDPVNNPEIMLSGSVFPSQEGMQQN